MRRSLVLLGAALAATLLVAACGDDDGVDDATDADVARTTGGSFDSDRGETVDALEGPGPADPTTAEESGAAGNDAAFAPTSGVQGLPSVATRKVIFTSSLALEAEEVASTFHEVSQVARSVGGFVESSDLQSFGAGEDRYEQAYITIRVPAEAYNDALADLRALGGAEVTRETSRSTEVTEEYTDVQSRLRTLEATEARYLELLEEARTVSDILTLTDRLDGVRLQIEQLEGRLQVLDDLVDLASIAVEIDPVQDEVLGSDGDGRKSIGEAFSEAWDDSLDAVAAVGVGAAYVAVGAVWLVVPLLIVVGIVARVWKSSAKGEAEVAS